MINLNTIALILADQMIKSEYNKLTLALYGWSDDQIWIQKLNPSWSNLNTIALTLALYGWSEW